MTLLGRWFPMSAKLLTVPEVAQHLQVTNARVYELVREGTVQAVRLGRQIRINPTILQDFIDRGGAALPGGWKRQSE
jgi:excisionase family DNA binding protein